MKKKTIESLPPVLHPCTDEHLRKMRNAVYPPQQTTQIQHLASWEQVKPKWREDEAWLTREYEKVLRAT